MNKDNKEKAIQLRREGKAYNEILKEVPVAKSTLSSWLRDVGLSKPKQQVITEKRKAAQLKGAQARRTQRLNEVQVAKEEGALALPSITPRELWLIGVALYWAEGSKQNKRSPSTGIIFGNTDFRMLKVFLLWLRQCDVSSNDICFELYIHESRRQDTPAFKEWWTEVLEIPIEKLEKTYYKKGNIKTKRTNIGDLYHGLLRIRVNSSTALNRKNDGWISGIVAALGSSVTGNTSAFEAEDSRIVP